MQRICSRCLQSWAPTMRARILVAVSALEQVGLVTVPPQGPRVYALVPAQGKKNLADAPILKCLEGT